MRRRRRKRRGAGGGGSGELPLRIKRVNMRAHLRGGRVREAEEDNMPSTEGFDMAFAMKRGVSERVREA